MGILYNIPIIVEPAVGLLSLLAIAYTMLTIPIILMAITNMANNSTLLSAFKFREILKKIANIGFLNFSAWYIVVGTLFLIILTTGTLITHAIAILIHPTIGKGLLSLIIIPYLYMYLSRSIALIYRSDTEKTL